MHFYKFNQMSSKAWPHGCIMQVREKLNFRLSEYMTCNLIKIDLLFQYDEREKKKKINLLCVYSQNPFRRI